MGKEGGSPSESGGEPKGGEKNQKQDASGQKQMQGQEDPQQKGEKPGGKEEGSTGDPSGNQEGKENNKPGAAKPAKGETGKAQAVLPGSGTWGNLPLHMRDIFRSEGGSDMPARYRDWIDNYYRRLNKEGGR